jgi:recombination protein RecA
LTPPDPAGRIYGEGAMLSAARIRQQIESDLADRIPSALTPVPRTSRSIVATGIQCVDELLDGGLPLGAITEVVGPECSGRTSFALSVLAGITQASKVCAWIDVSDGLDPESAAAAGVELSRLLWVRCGVPDMSDIVSSSQPAFVLPDKYFVPPPIKKGLHGGGFGSHPRNEVRGLSDAVSGLLRSEAVVSRHTALEDSALRGGTSERAPSPFVSRRRKKAHSSGKPWSRIGQALHVADLLLQSGGFSAIVLDMCSIAPEDALRVPLSTWFRYRAAAERTHTSILLLTQHSCAKSSAELLLRLEPGSVHHEGSTVLNEIEHRLEVARRRFTQFRTIVAPLRKSPQSAISANWCSRTTWAGPR